jgi:hypothetical protein
LARFIAPCYYASCPSKGAINRAPCGIYLRYYGFLNLPPRLFFSRFTFPPQAVVQEFAELVVDFYANSGDFGTKARLCDSGYGG